MLRPSFRSAVQCVCTHQPIPPKPHTAPVPKSSHIFLPVVVYIFWHRQNSHFFFPRHKFCLRKNIEWRKKEKKNCAVIRHFDDDENRKIRRKKTCGKNAQYSAHGVHALYLHVRVRPARSADYCHFVQHLTMLLLG